VSSPKPDTHSKDTIKLFWRVSRRYPRLLWSLLALLPLIVFFSNIVLPYITATLLDRLSTGAYDPHHVWSSFAMPLMSFAIGSIATGIIGWRLAAWLSWSLQLKVTRDLNQHIFDHLVEMSPGFHANRFSGSLVSQANKLSSAYVRVSDPTAYNLIPLVVVMTSTIVVLAPRAPVYVSVLVVLAITHITGTIYFARKVRVANAQESALQSRQTGYLADSLANISAIKTFSAGGYERQRYGHLGQEVWAAGRRSMLATLARQNYAAIVVQGLFISSLVIAVVGVGILHHSIGTILLIVSYTGSIAERLWDFQSILRQYNRAFGDASDMIEILQIPPEITDPPRPEPAHMRTGAIAFKDVSFTHSENDEALFQDFNLQIQAGEKIGLVGHSGSGKTTLMRLLLRFADLDAGSITIDNQNITSVTQDNLRHAISYVPQEPLLFHRSLAENIAYGNPKATMREIHEAAEGAHAAEFIERLPKGYNTLVGERGIKLSGGQRQRIAIARAMLKAAPILALDEATSALDSESEKLIQDALWRLMEGRTAIVIAHRLSTIQHMDRIVVLENGRIIEQGSHAELLAAAGTYAKLWSHQSGGFMAD